MHNLIPFGFDGTVQDAAAYVKGLLEGVYRPQYVIDDELVKKLAAYVPLKTFTYQTPRHSGSGFNSHHMEYLGDGRFRLPHGVEGGTEDVAWSLYHNAATLLPSMKPVGDLFAEKERLMLEKVGNNS